MLTRLPHTELNVLTNTGEGNIRKAHGRILGSSIKFTTGIQNPYVQF